jgi:hypothetical protein
MDGFKKLGEMRTGNYSDDMKEPEASTAGAAMALGSYAREVPFDRLPLHIQDWSRRCRESRVSHG